MIPGFRPPRIEMRPPEPSRPVNEMAPHDSPSYGVPPRTADARSVAGARALPTRRGPSTAPIAPGRNLPSAAFARTTLTLRDTAGTLMYFTLAAWNDGQVSRAETQNIDALAKQSHAGQFESLQPLFSRDGGQTKHRLRA